MKRSESYRRCYRHNLEVLRRRDARLAGEIGEPDHQGDSKYLVEEAESGLPTIKVQNGECSPRYLHSRVDPETGGMLWAQSVAPETPAVAVLGFGFGYHCFALRRRGYTGSMLVIEADRLLFRRAMFHQNLAPLFHDHRVSWLIDGQMSELHTLLTTVDTDRIAVLPYGPAWASCPDYYERARIAIHAYLHEKRLAQKPDISRDIAELMRCLLH